MGAKTKVSVKRAEPSLWDKIKHKFALFIDKFALSFSAQKQLFKQPKQILILVIAFIASAYFLTFFKDGSANWNLLFSGLPFGEKMTVLGRVFLAIPKNFTSFYGITIMLMSLLQAICITLLIYAYKNRAKNSAIDGAGTGGIGAILGFLALGCPSCGVTFVTPILTMFAGAGAAALTESVSNVLMVLAFVLMLYTIAQLGYVDYALISTKKLEEKEKKNGRK